MTDDQILALCIALGIAGCLSVIRCLTILYKDQIARAVRNATRRERHRWMLGILTPVRVRMLEPADLRTIAEMEGRRLMRELESAA